MRGLGWGPRGPSWWPPLNFASSAPQGHPEALGLASPSREGRPSPAFLWPGRLLSEDRWGGSLVTSPPRASVSSSSNGQNKVAAEIRGMWKASRSIQGPSVSPSVFIITQARAPPHPPRPPHQWVHSPRSWPEGRSQTEPQLHPQPHGPRSTWEGTVVGKADAPPSPPEAPEYGTRNPVESHPSSYEAVPPLLATLYGASPALRARI